MSLQRLPMRLESLERVTVRDCLKAARLPRLESQLLLAHVLGVSRTWLIAHDDAELESQQARHYLQLCAKRELGQPVAYLLGQREFMGLMLEVNPAVLIPRPETELIVTHVLEQIDAQAPVTILDLGTGSGAIAIALAKACPAAVVFATDVSAQALAVAQSNAQRHEVPITLLQGSWFDALIGLDCPKFDAIVSNPPYIAKDDDHLLQPELRCEPAIALTDGGDGLGAYRSILASAARYLKPGGLVCVEHGFEQAPAVSGLFRQAGFSDVMTLPDLAGLPRVTAGSYNSEIR